MREWGIFEGEFMVVTWEHSAAGSEYAKWATLRSIINELWRDFLRIMR